MNKTIKELEVGKEYIFIEATPNKTKDLNVVRAILKSCEKGDRGWFPEFETNDELKGEFFFIHELRKTNSPLNEIMVILVNSNYDKPEAKEKLEGIFGAMANPIGFIMCDAESIDETIQEYTEFLTKSLEAYHKKIKDMQEDLMNKTRIYTEQIKWLETTKF